MIVVFAGGWVVVASVEVELSESESDVDPSLSKVLASPGVEEW